MRSTQQASDEQTKRASLIIWLQAIFPHTKPLYRSSKKHIVGEILIKFIPLLVVTYARYALIMDTIGREIYLNAIKRIRREFTKQIKICLLQKTYYLNLCRISDVSGVAGQNYYASHRLGVARNVLESFCNRHSIKAILLGIEKRFAKCFTSTWIAKWRPGCEACFIKLLRQKKVM